jgi:hypothetical protein
MRIHRKTQIIIPEAAESKYHQLSVLNAEMIGYPAKYPAKAQRAHPKMKSRNNAR